MDKGENNLNRGFTIIEVALVLAIAGLIFLMVFVALPGLRASQRDAERREAMTSFLESVKKYQTNNRGALPGSSENDSLNAGGTIRVDGGNAGSGDTTWAGFYQKYLGNNFIDPSGERYRLTVIKCGMNAADQPCGDAAQYNDDVTFPNDYRILVVLQASCSGTNTISTANPRKLAVVYKLEGAGTYCANI